jgi:hypothetical protein
MWITKIEFKNNIDKNETLIIEKSTTEEFAMQKFNRELDRWCTILFDIKILFDPYPNVNDAKLKDKIKRIQNCLLELDKHNSKDRSFTAEIYEEIENSK